MRRRVYTVWKRWALAFAIGLLAGLGVLVFGRKTPPANALPALGEGSTTGRAMDWRSVLGRAWSASNTNHLSAVAGGVTFFVLLAIFPALGVFVSLYGLSADLTKVRSDLANLRGIVPDGAIAILTQQMTRLALAPRAQLGWAFAGSTLASLWSANAGFKALIVGLNLAYNVKERRNLFILNLVSLSLTLGGVGLLGIGTALAGWVTHLAPKHALLITVLRWPAFLAGVAGFLSLLYRFAPSRPTKRRRWVTLPGSAFAAAGWMAMSLVFSGYVANFAHYDRTYGSLGAIVGFMTWIWLSLTVVLMGAELNAQLEPMDELRAGLAVAIGTARTSAR